ncbi:TetR/AcrR family transcriptional regulator [Rhizobium sp. FY34]|uniref:TetR/AcrR family transcriptional regulator n=1 Tax=Rhizobium sp. FY34 TaxID=2562309 RepID=UPI00197FC21D|nr:TetR/AcrR family transcriptional regulator [Rhizobium sp. FY34]
MMTISDRPASPKREATRMRNREAIKAAAWQVFCAKGLDASTVRDIVTTSGASIGTFYNYYGTREAVFQEVLADLADQIRTITQAARASQTALDPMLAESYRDFLQFILGIEGALDFCALNQHHIRSYLFTLDATSGLLSDIRSDILRVMPGATFSPHELAQVANLIVANALEILLQAREGQDLDVASAVTFITRLIVGGIGSWDTSSTPPK